MFTRFSRKRQSILECLQNTAEHPSAEWIYNKLKPVYPDLSLGTVYRNLGQLVEQGKIQSLGTVADKERFDAEVQPHTHAICSKCGKITDVFEINISDEIISKAAVATDFEIEYSKLQLIGICKECKHK